MHQAAEVEFRIVNYSIDMQKSFSFNGWHINASSEVTEEGVLYMFEDTMLRNEQESSSIPRISEGKERLSSL
ncbi:MAG: hypothetical protein QXZ17_15810, partial [Nitrososphaerota archaeon]